MLIRKAESKDSEQIVFLGKHLLELHTEWEKDYYALEDNFNYSFASWVTEQTTNQSKFLYVAEDNGKIVGFVSGYLKSFYPWFKIKSVGHISFLYILPDYRRKKIGKLLTEKSADWFRSNNVKYIEVFADEKNTIAVNAWKSYGFGDFKRFLRKSLCL